MGKAGKGRGQGKASIAALKRSPTHLLFRVLQVATDLYGQEAGPSAVTQRQYTILAAVSASQSPNQNQLVRATGVDRSTLADLVARMIGLGLLARERSAADGRAKVVTLTDEGRAALEAVSPRVAAADERLLALLAPKKRDSFMRLLNDLAHSGDPLPVDGEGETTEADDPGLETDIEAPAKAAKPRKREASKSDKKKDGKKKKKKKAKSAAMETPAAAGEPG